MYRRFTLNRFNRLSTVPVVFLLLLLLFVPIQFAKADNWVEVVRYGGKSAAFITEPFTCNYSEWRIRYESYVGTHFPMIIPGVYLLNVTTYPQGETNNYIDRISESPTQGKYYFHLIHNRTGTFYMNISTGYSDHYSIIVEQNIDSVLATPIPPASPTPTSSNPENNSATWSVTAEVIFAVAVIAAIIIIVIAVAVVKRKKAG